MEDFVERLKQRKLVQWALAYAAAAFALIQVLDIVAQRFGWPDSVERFAIVAMAAGFFVTLVLAWYHGERGVQKTTSAELLILALLLTIGGVVAWRLAPAPATTKADVASRSPAVGSTAATVIPGKSIAVLPFVNMSGDPKNDYFSDGITEEILDVLAQVPKLKVAARTSAFAFKGKAEDLRKVGEVLDVATVLEGSVQTSGDEVRITAQLIDTQTGYHLWSEKYDRKLTSIFAVEDEISKAIADKLQVQLNGADGQSLVAQKAVDPLAHDFYLRGLTLLAARSVKESAKAFQQAVAIDPDYAQSWAALAEAEALLPSYASDPAQAAYARSLDASQHALALDPGVALAYVARGMVDSNQMQWSAADTAFQRALALAPGDAEAMDQYAQFLYAVGQLKPALAEIDRALQRDPLSGVSGAVRTQLLLSLHQDDAALQQIEGTLAAHPDGVFAHRTAVWVYLAFHRYAEAERQVLVGTKLDGGDPEIMGLLVRGITDPRVHPSALQALQTSPGLSNIRKDVFLYATFLMALGEHERALTALESFTPNGESITFQFLWHPQLDPIRNDPRFIAVLKKLGLPYTPSKGAAP